jgi:type I restriction enzyme S subunit
MAGEWQETTWGDLATLEYGKALRNYQDTPSTARVFGTNGPIGWHHEALWCGPGVIVGRKGAYRGVHYTKDPYWVIDTAYSLQPKSSINLRWAYYQLKSIDLNNVDDGSPIPSTTRPAFYALPVLKPPRATQDRIADLLSSLDDKIELNRLVAETLEAIARVLFRSWFVDFDPVRAKAEGHPTRLSDETAALFPSSFGDDALPAGWSLEPLREHLDVLSGGTPSKGDARYWGGDIPWVTPRSMMQSHVFDTADRVTEDAVGNGTRLAPCGSIMVMVRGMGLHQAVRISQVRRDVTFNQDVKALVSKNLDSAFLLYFMLHCQEDLLTKVRASGHGTGVLPSNALESLMIPVPPVESQQRLFLPFGLFNSRIATSRMEASILATMRDTLLPKLISGDLRIADAEKRISAA